jgi:PIN domain nuclease of toxin-antitoxin system
LSIYLDTQILVWLGQGQVEKLTPAATQAIESSDLIISPMVLLELQYLFEIKKVIKPPVALLSQLTALIGLKVSDHPFPAVVQAALFETWTRDPFDRVIVAQARSDSYSGLISSDTTIQQHYSKTVWNVKSS